MPKPLTTTDVAVEVYRLPGGTQIQVTHVPTGRFVWKVLAQGEHEGTAKARLLKDLEELVAAHEKAEAERAEKS